MKIYKGTVRADATPYVLLRPEVTATTSNGKLYPGKSFEGEGEIVFYNGFNRMKITKYDGFSIAGYAASEYLTYTVEEVNPEVPQLPETIWLSLTEGGEQVPYDKRV